VLAVEGVFLLVASGLVLFFGLDGEVSRAEGGVLLLGFVAFLVFVFTRGRDEADEVRQELEKYVRTGTGLMQNLARLVIGAAVLFFGSRYVVTNASVIGQGLGFGAALTGLTVVAAGTALPDVATAVLAARQGQGNVVAGQVLGACLFNLLVVVGGMAAIHPLAIPASFMRIELPAAMAFVLALYPVLTPNSRVGRREGGIVLALFAAWLVFESLQATH
jgi:cation:H+ antiporter